MQVATVGVVPTGVVKALACAVSGGRCGEDTCL